MLIWCRMVLSCEEIECVKCIASNTTIYRGWRYEGMDSLNCLEHSKRLIWVWLVLFVCFGWSRLPWNDGWSIKFPELNFISCMLIGANGVNEPGPFNLRLSEFYYSCWIFCDFVFIVVFLVIIKMVWFSDLVPTFELLLPIEMCLIWIQSNCTHSSHNAKKMMMLMLYERMNNAMFR